MGSNTSTQTLTYKSIDSQPLFRAVENNEIKQFELLLTKENVNNYEINRVYIKEINKEISETSLLTYCVIYNRPEFIRMLIENNVNMNAATCKNMVVNSFKYIYLYETAYSLCNSIHMQSGDRGKILNLFNPYFLSGDWMETKSPEGKTLYYDLNTNRTTYDRNECIIIYE